MDTAPVFGSCWDQAGVPNEVTSRSPPRAYPLLQFLDVGRDVDQLFGGQRGGTAALAARLLDGRPAGGGRRRAGEGPAGLFARLGRGGLAQRLLAKPNRQTTSLAMASDAPPPLQPPPPPNADLVQEGGVSRVELQRELPEAMSQRRQVDLVGPAAHQARPQRRRRLQVVRAAGCGGCARKTYPSVICRYAERKSQDFGVF